VIVCTPEAAKNLISTIPRTSVIDTYFLPKIHKSDNPGRPIVSCCSCATGTKIISNFLDCVIMAPRYLLRRRLGSISGRFGKCVFRFTFLKVARKFAPPANVPGKGPAEEMGTPG
jgi:hypothetical protein